MSDPIIYDPQDNKHIDPVSCSKCKQKHISVHAGRYPCYATHIEYGTGMIESWSSGAYYYFKLPNSKPLLCNPCVLSVPTLSDITYFTELRNFYLKNRKNFYMEGLDGLQTLKEKHKELSCN